MSDFLMPSLGADMEAGTLVKWRVAPGDQVARGDIVAEVDTDKGLIEIECFEGGIVDRLVVEPGAKVPVGTVLAVIRGEGAAPKAPPSGPPAAEQPAPEPATAAAPKPPGTPVAAASKPPVPPPAPIAAPRLARAVRVSPLARKRAAELGIDLAAIRGSGPGGAIQAADIEQAAAPVPSKPSAPSAPPAAPAAPAEAAAPSVAPAAGMRRAIAAAMARSKRDIPHYYLQTTIDATPLQAFLRTENEQRPIESRLLPIVILLKGVARALRDVPALNGFWIDGEPRPSEAIHIGVAIAMKGGGLVAPAVHDVDRASFDDLMATLRDLIPRARAGRLRSSEMTDATITVTSLGDLGVEGVFGVIYPPQVALVGFGAIVDRPWAEHGMVGVRPVITASLAADHRATDGHTGALFLTALGRHLQAPESL